MLTIKPGEHGSTFGGNPVACEVAMAALNVIRDEKLAENAAKMGVIFREKLQSYINGSKIVEEIRGKGLLNAIIINDEENSDIAWNICLKMAQNGLLAKPTHGNIIRFAPPLIINEEQLNDCIDIIISSLKDFE
jgi:ornithine--oxo-acid transaminase